MKAGGNLYWGGYLALVVSVVFVSIGEATIPSRKMVADPVEIGMRTRLGVCNRTVLCNTGGVPNGAALAGNGLVWQTDYSTNRLNLLDVENGCNVLHSCPAPGGALPSELAFLGGILYHYDFGTGRLYGVDPATCQVVSECDPPGDDYGEGLTTDGTYLWKGDSENLYKFLPPDSTGNCVVVATCPNPPGDAADGLAYCDDRLIMLGYSGSLYKIDPRSCIVVGLCQLNQGSEGNGLTVYGVNMLLTDDVAGNLDRVEEGCDIPLPTRESTWGAVKALYR